MRPANTRSFAGSVNPVFNYLVIPLFLIFPAPIAVTAQDQAEIKSTEQFKGPFMKLFEVENCLFIYPTSPESLSNMDNEIKILNTWAGYCKDSEIISDSMALATDVSNRHVFAAGNEKTNLWIGEQREELLFTLTDTYIRTDTIYYGENMLLTFCQPNPVNPEKGWFFLSGQKPESYLIKPGNYGFVTVDWTIRDSAGTVTMNDFIKHAGKWIYDRSRTDIRDDAKWIWYPGDFEIELNRRTSLLRKERNEIYPPLWRLDAPYGSIHFIKWITLPRPDTLSVYADGDFTVMVNGNRLYDYDPENLVLLAGGQYVQINVINFEGLPALLVKGRQVISDTSWRASLGWREEELVPGTWIFNEPNQPPASFRLNEKEIRPESTVRTDTSLYADFGQETFGRLILEDISGSGKIMVVYGESEAEASAGKRAETWEILDYKNEESGTDTLPVPMAFRYVNLIPQGNVSIGDVSHLYEYLPLEKHSTFKCDDEILNEIFRASSRTLVLNSRELLFDGIKRDRWCWSGDVFIGLPLAYYHYFDEDLVRRSLIALRGHDPVIHHINTIPDWSFYWFINIYNHHLFTGDTLLIRQMYDKMTGLMDFCLEARDGRGFYSFRDSDWPFIDWSMMPFNKVQSFQQILLLRSLEVMEYFARMLGKVDDVGKYDSIASDLRQNTWDLFWKDNAHGFTHHHTDSGAFTITRYSNLYSILFGYLDSEQVSDVRDHILLNDTIPEVGTPFHRTFELAALCEAGEHNLAVQKMRDHWKGMLDLGATTFWEFYKPEQTGLQHYEHSKRPFCRSLCHIWGAGPIYIFSRYIGGLKPVEPGYKAFLVEPNLCGLEWFETEMPVKGGRVRVSMDQNRITVHSDIPGGTVRFSSKKRPKVSQGDATKIGDNRFELEILEGREYTIRYY